MLVAVAHRGILTELLVGAVVGEEGVLAAVAQPSGGSLDAEVVVARSRQFALSVAALQYALRQGHGGRYAVTPHLLHGIFSVLACVFLIFPHCLSVVFRLSFHSA